MTPFPPPRPQRVERDASLQQREAVGRSVAPSRNGPSSAACADSPPRIGSTADRRCRFPPPDRPSTTCSGGRSFVSMGDLMTSRPGSTPGRPMSATPPPRVRRRRPRTGSARPTTPSDGTVRMALRLADQVVLVSGTHREPAFTTQGDALAPQTSGFGTVAARQAAGKCTAKRGAKTRRSPVPGGRVCRSRIHAGCRAARCSADNRTIPAPGSRWDMRFWLRGAFTNEGDDGPVPRAAAGRQGRLLSPS